MHRASGLPSFDGSDQHLHRAMSSLPSIVKKHRHLYQSHESMLSPAKSSRMSTKSCCLRSTTTPIKINRSHSSMFQRNLFVQLLCLFSLIQLSNVLSVQVSQLFVFFCHFINYLENAFDFICV